MPQAPRTMYIKKYLNAKGEVVKVDGGYVYINHGGLTLKKNMNLIGYVKWSHYDKDGDGIPDTGWDIKGADFDVSGSVWEVNGVGSSITLTKVSNLQIIDNEIGRASCRERV